MSITPLQRLLDAAAAHRAGTGSEDEIKDAAITYLSHDDEAIPSLLRILQEERAWRKELVLDMGEETSRLLFATSLLIQPGRKPAHVLETGAFVVDKAKAFYRKWAAKIRPTMKFPGLD